MPADAEVVFDVLTDPDSAAHWLPDNLRVELTAPRLLRMWFAARPEFDVVRRVHIDWRFLRITIGDPNTESSFTARLRVITIVPGHCAVTMDVNGGGRVRTRGRTDLWTEHALHRLAEHVRTRSDALVGRPTEPSRTKNLLDPTLTPEGPDPLVADMPHGPGSSTRHDYQTPHPNNSPPS